MQENDSPIEYKAKNNATNNSIIEMVKEWLSSEAFAHKIVGDTPLEGNQLVPRKFVTANGITASRPPNPVTGQFYYDTQIGKPIWWNGSVWKDAQNNTV